MRYQLEEVNRVQILRLSGEVNNTDTQNLRNIIERLIQTGKSNILLDLEELRFLDSHTILMLLRMMREALAAGGNIKLLHAGSVVKHFLSIGRVATLFECYNTRVEAISSFEIEKKRQRLTVQQNSLDDQGSRQRETLSRLVGLLIEKGYFNSDEFFQELKQSQWRVFDLYKHEFIQPAQNPEPQDGESS